MSRLWLIDASSVGAWCHYAVSGQSAHADLVEGVRSWWNDLAERYNPSHAVALFDCSRASNWRTKLYPEYKSGRDARPKDEELAEGLRKLPDEFKRLGVPTLREEGFEADDLIAALAARHDGEVIVITSDKDMHQLVDDRVRCYDPRPNKAGECVFYDVAKVTEKHGVPPHRLRELLAIQGDSSDSIRGVEGWGAVAAKHAIQQTRSKLELVRKACAGQLQKISEAKQIGRLDVGPDEKPIYGFKQQVKDFELAYQLVGLRFDAPIPDGFNTAIRRSSEAA